MEEDFFVRSRTSLIPVEVKTKTGKTKSMRELIQSTKYPDIQYGIKLSKNNIGYENAIYTIPYFCAFLVKRFIQTLDMEQ